MSMGGGGTNTTVQQSDPWVGQRPYLRKAYGRADRNYWQDLGEQYFSGPTVADDSAVRALATQGGNLTPAANESLLRTIQGDYLGGGDFMRAYGNDIANDVNAQFALGGRTGSGYQSRALGSGLGDAAARLYDQERARQMQAIGMAPGLDAARYADANVLSQLDQRQIDADMAKWDWEQNRNNRALQNYIASIQGNVGGITSTTSPSSSGGLVGGLGGAAAGAGLASALSLTGPWGWGLAGLGALAGMQ